MSVQTFSFSLNAQLRREFITRKSISQQGELARIVQRMGERFVRLNNYSTLQMRVSRNEALFFFYLSIYPRFEYFEGKKFYALGDVLCTYSDISDISVYNFNIFLSLFLLLNSHTQRLEEIYNII